MSEENKFLSPADVYRVVTVDKKRGVKISVNLKDDDGDEVSIAEVSEKITEWIVDQMKTGEDRTAVNKVIPLVSNVTALSMSRLVGESNMPLFLSSNLMRHVIVTMTCTGFYLLKFMQQNKLKLYHTEEPVSQEEIEQMERIDDAGSALTKAAFFGMDLNSVAATMMSEGLIETEDLEKLGLDVDEVKSAKPLENPKETTKPSAN